jgi:predicted nucleic acid-binding protein
VSDFVLDASLALQWFLEDEADRKYSLGVLSSLAENRALVPLLWFYEIGNGLLMAHRRSRISFDQVTGYLTRLMALPIDTAQQSPDEILGLQKFALAHSLTIYDAAYLALAMKSNSALATTDNALKKAAASSGVKIV